MWQMFQHERDEYVIGVVTLRARASSFEDCFRLIANRAHFCVKFLELSRRLDDRRLRQQCAFAGKDVVELRLQLIQLGAMAECDSALDAARLK